MTLSTCLGWLHHHGGTDLAVDIGTKVDGGELDELCLHICWQVDDLHAKHLRVSLRVAAGTSM